MFIVTYKRKGFDGEWTHGEWWHDKADKDTQLGESAYVFKTYEEALRRARENEAGQLPTSQYYGFRVVEVEPLTVIYGYRVKGV